MSDDARVHFWWRKILGKWSSCIRPGKEYRVLNDPPATTTHPVVCLRCLWLTEFNDDCPCVRSTE